MSPRHITFEPVPLVTVYQPVLEDDDDDEKTVDHSSSTPMKKETVQKKFCCCSSCCTCTVKNVVKYVLHSIAETFLGGTAGYINDLLGYITLAALGGFSALVKTVSIEGEEASISDAKTKKLFAAHAAVSTPFVAAGLITGLWLGGTLENLSRYSKTLIFEEFFHRF